MLGSLIFAAALGQSILLGGTLSPALEKAFINQCVVYTQNQDACKCALKKLGPKYDLNTFISIENGSLPDNKRVAVLSDVFSAASECFVQDECSEDIEHILGKADAKKVCGCAVDRLLKMKDVDQAAFLAMDENFYAENEKRFEDKVMQEIMPCLPQKVTPAIRENLIAECAAESGNTPRIKALCSCVTDEVFKKYSLPDFIKGTFGESEELNRFMDEALQKCKK